MQTKKVKLFIGEKVYLKPFEKEDIEVVYDGICNEKIRKLTGLQRVYTKNFMDEYSEKISNDASRVFLLIVTSDNDTIIGDVEINSIDTFNRNANIRIEIHNEDYLGNGYGTEAMQLMLKHGFGTLNLHRIELEVFSYNARAIKAYEKLGFKKEGVKRQSLYYDFAYHDAITMSMLKEEFINLYVNIKG
ncbi:RimJ/RimL family protein N-acetyltransferase [Salirhabdus euzebyi]|uniref:RimJ/RimL family protein N-acetyltransferase n=1 Tax=Salirhabdus euzebyi TaxID=394506 RepID=A0A841Q967_9BACI|nr:GNAT family protein [Salirhabdus euzebyi]MBB6454936.1 RimJ/RimL family protein N-acetyltransferase [Salirhabdus euzebyi]